MTNYFIHNLETDKLNIFTGRENWKLLTEALRDLIKRNCLFSRAQSCWISKAKGGRVWWIDQLTTAGFENRGAEGERLSFAEQVDAKQERAESRAERFEDRAIKAEAESERRHKVSHDMMAAIPMGQPILVGHHSEKRDRNYRDRAWNHLGKAVEASKKSEYYAGRAETALHTASGAEFSDPAFLGRRISDVEVELRKLNALLEGKTYVDSSPATFAVTDEYRAKITALIEAQQEKRDFYKQKLAETGAVVFNGETLKGKKEVLIRHGWEPIVKLNPKTVSVPNICFPRAEDQARYALKYEYSQVRDAR